MKHPSKIENNFIRRSYVVMALPVSMFIMILAMAFEALTSVDGELAGLVKSARRVWREANK